VKVWETPFEELRWPVLTNLRMDPFEKAVDETVDFPMWAADRMFMLAPSGAYVAQWLQSFRDFPPRMKPGSFNLDRVMEAATASGKGRN
jgi:arylsulfatase